MVFIDLKNIYLQIPVHPDSRQFLHFVAFGVPYQFKALCFGLSTAPQVFTRVMAPVSTMFHRLGIRMLRYLDDWLVLASSRTSALWARDMVFSLCRDLGILVNLAKCHLVPAWSVTYLGMSIVAPTLRAFPSPESVSALLTLIDEFLSYRRQGVVSWHSLLGRLSSLCLLGGRLWLGFRGRIGDGRVVSVEPGGSSLVVRPLQSSSRGFPGGGSSQPSLPVRHLRPRVGCSSPQPVCFGPLVSSIFRSFGQSVWNSTTFVICCRVL